MKYKAHDYQQYATDFYTGASGKLSDTGYGTWQDSDHADCPVAFCCLIILKSAGF